VAQFDLKLTVRHGLNRRWQYRAWATAAKFVDKIGGDERAGLMTRARRVRRALFMFSDRRRDAGKRRGENEAMHLLRWKTDLAGSRERALIKVVTTSQPRTHGMRDAQRLETK
jgi:hypothetical protein